MFNASIPRVTSKKVNFSSSLQAFRNVLATRCLHVFNELTGYIREYCIVKAVPTIKTLRDSYLKESWPVKASFNGLFFSLRVFVVGWIMQEVYPPT
jgi:hypothetical protein